MTVGRGDSARHRMSETLGLRHRSLGVEEALKIQACLFLLRFDVPNKRILFGER
jgi:hypothetical protein